MHRATALPFSLMFFAACATQADVERCKLTEALGIPPYVVLRAIGSAPDAKTASAVAASWHEKLDARTELRLLRFGLGSDDPRVVLGALVWNGSDTIVVPELRNAATVVIPHLADPGCGDKAFEALRAVGSVDLPAVAAVIPKMDPATASNFLGHVHRMVRADGVPALCELALATTGEVRRIAFDNAELAGRYSGEHTELLVTTWLRIVGATPDPDRGGLSGTLRAALRAFLDMPRTPAPAQDRRPPGLPDISCMRWLMASRPSLDDLPLLARLVNGDYERLRHGALQALAAMDDAESLRILMEARIDDDDLGVGELTVFRARARRGDQNAFEQLLERPEEGVACALSAASPGQRRAFAETLLAAPTEEAIATLRGIAWWAAAEGMWFAIPPYRDEFLADLEPLAAAAERVDTRVLRKLIASVPGCATKRLGEKLLARPVPQLVAPADEYDELLREPLGDLGYAGAWPFLEVTCPDAFRTKLREGLGSGDLAVRNACGGLLLRAGEAEDVDRLAAWIERPRGEDEEEVDDEEWLLLARTGGRAAEPLFRARCAGTPEDERWLRPLAVALGMPIEVAQAWGIEPEQIPSVREALFAGDAGLAFVRSLTADREVPRALFTSDWRDPRFDPLVCNRRSPDPSPDDIIRHDHLRALYSGDRAALDATMRAVRDGRYATHYGVDEPVKAHAEPLETTIEFWIGELGTNCCRAAVAEEVLTLLFRNEGRAFDAQFEEPAVLRLRRTLLPKIDRLRWSRIANAYVIAGN